MEQRLSRVRAKGLRRLGYLAAHETPAPQTAPQDTRAEMRLDANGCSRTSRQFSPAAQHAQRGRRPARSWALPGWWLWLSLETHTLTGALPVGGCRVSCNRWAQALIYNYKNGSKGCGSGKPRSGRRRDQVPIRGPKNGLGTCKWPRRSQNICGPHPQGVEVSRLAAPSTWQQSTKHQHKSGRLLCRTHVMQGSKTCAPGYPLSIDVH